jgi:predicted metal-dependent hydrolase
MITLPKKIYLTAMRKQWKVSYIKSPGKLIIIEAPRRELVLYGKNYSKKAALHLLTRWIILKSHDYLTDLVKKLNRRVKVNYKKLVVKSHEAQWGSYSTTKTISLNYKIIFLPHVLVKHIIYHELCHAIHLSHSDKFWRELARFDKNAHKNNEALDAALPYVPRWVLLLK